MKINDITIAYGTNYWSHHQAPVAKVLADILGEKHFRLVLFEPVDTSRKQLGWSTEENYPWIIGPPKNTKELERLENFCMEADVLVFGGQPTYFLEERAKAGKLTMLSTERRLKKGYHHLRMFNPRYRKGIKNYRSVVNSPDIHALTIGHYAAKDFKRIRAFEDRFWRWGYFVDINPIPPDASCGKPLNLLWVGRMIRWKRVDLILRAVAKLKKTRNFGVCTIVGDGPQRQRLISLSRRLNIENNCMRFLEPVPYNNIRRLMREADVYVLASNEKEGWGAVAGEAFSEGCILVANEKAGAARELIQHGETGFLFQDGNVNQLVSIINNLAMDFDLRKSVRKKAWEHARKFWHPKIAGERLVTLCRGLLRKTSMPNYKHGPCTKVRLSEI